MVTFENLSQKISGMRNSQIGNVFKSSLLPMIKSNTDNVSLDDPIIHRAIQLEQKNHNATNDITPIENSIKVKNPPKMNKKGKSVKTKDDK